MALERKSSLKKAPVEDVVVAITGTPDQASLDQVKPAATASQAHELETSRPTASSSDADTAPERARPRPGRPRSKRRMEPFSTKIEIDLRDRMDDYVTSKGMTVVDFLDNAIRQYLNEK